MSLPKFYTNFVLIGQAIFRKHKHYYLLYANEVKYYFLYFYYKFYGTYWKKQKPNIKQTKKTNRKFTNIFVSPCFITFQFLLLFNLALLRKLKDEWQMGVLDSFPPTKKKFESVS